MTLDDMLTTLSTQSPGAALIFATEDAQIAAGYHVTELKLARITSIDCGGHVSDWAEAALQLLDGNGGQHMRVGTFVGIFRKSIGTIKDLGTTPVHVEFAPGNRGLSKFDIADIGCSVDTTLVHLRPAKALCKPAIRFAKFGCCGVTEKQAVCCA